MPIVTASKLPAASSNILRKSTNRFALAYFSPAFVSLLSSTSQIATTSPNREASCASVPPRPSTPIQASRMRSLGEVDSAAARVEIKYPPPRIADVIRKSRRFLRADIRSLLLGRKNRMGREDQRRQAADSR